MAEKPLRADAARNRARLLEVAGEVFAAEGAAVPVDEIARRAGVGAGTVYRHFPTKEALFQAIVAHRMEQVAARGRELAATRDPGEALFDFLGHVVAAGSRDQGLVDALAHNKPAEEMTEIERRFAATLAGLVDGAKRAGDIRFDVDAVDVRTLLVGVQAMQRYSPAATDRVMDVVRAGLST